jgi:hypothetical protein
MFLLLFLCAFSLALGKNSQVVYPSSYQYSYDVNPRYSVSWSIENSNLAVKVVSKANAWAGICFKPDGDGMTHGDCVIATLSNGNVKVNDYYNTHKDTPILDTSLGGSNYLLLSRGSITNKHMTYEFVRPLNASDKYDQAISKGFMAMSWAHGQDGSSKFSEHPNGAAGKFQIDWYNGIGGGAGGALITAHAILGAVAYGVLMVLGSQLALYGKQWGLWFKLHIAMQATGVGLALLTAILGIVSTGGSFSEAHHFLGIITVGLSLFQPILGWLADRMWNAKRSKIPIWPDKIHWWFGHIIIALSIASVLTGMVLLKVKAVYIIIFAVWAGVNILVYLAGYIWREVCLRATGESRFVAKGKEVFHINFSAVDEKEMGPKGAESN